MDGKRLIEEAFPLEQASIESLHEKNVRHGHISTLHIWPARRPLAACRAALIATLLPDPGNDEERQSLWRGSAARWYVEKETRPPRGRRRSAATETVGGVYTGAASPVRTWTGSATRSARPTADGRPACSTLSPAAAPSRWRPCAWAARSRRWISTPWPGSSSNAPWNIRSGWPARSVPLPDFACNPRVHGPLPQEDRHVAGKTGRSSAVIPNNRPVQSTLFGTEPGAIEADLAWHVRAWGWWVLQRARPTSPATIPPSMASPP